MTHRLDALQTTTAVSAPRFDSALTLHARSLILLMALAFAVLPGLIFRRRRHPFAVHVAFSLHRQAFMLLLFCVVTTVEGVNLWHGAVEAAAENLDRVLSLALMVACATYLYVAIEVVYGGNRTGCVLRAVTRGIHGTRRMTETRAAR